MYSGEIPAEVYEYVAANQKIHAIKALRTATGLGLAEAKDIVDQIAAGTYVGSSVPHQRAHINLGAAGSSAGGSHHGSTNKIQAIKDVRAATGLGLAEAKAIVDQMGAGAAGGVALPPEIVHRKSGKQNDVMQWYEQDVQQMARLGYVEVEHHIEEKAGGLLSFGAPKVEMVVTYRV
jgi:ribosomal protein L7/L12